jgi:hypothetical protein
LFVLEDAGMYGYLGADPAHADRSRPNA